MSTMLATAFRGRALRIGLALLLAVGMVLVQTRVDIARAQRNPDDLLYLPNERLLNHFTAGTSNVIADYLWVQCCTYVGRQVQSTWSFEWLQQMVNTVVRLDPYFVPAYRYGAMFLAALRQDENAALELLHRGMVLNPEAWELPYEAAMVHLLNRKGEADSAYNAAFYLTLAVDTGNAPAFVAETAASLQGQYNLISLEKEMWEKLLDSEDQLLRDMAKAKLEEVRIRRNLEVLGDLIERHRVQYGALPESLERLIEVGYIPAIEPDHQGGKYFLGPNGKAMNETLQANAARDQRSNIEEAIRAYKEKNSGFPESLEAAANSVGMPVPVVHPMPGKQWTYDPATGTLGEAADG